jgi:hypothetical protein
MESVQVRDFEGVVYMTSATTEVADVTPKMLDEAGLNYSNDEQEGFYPLNEQEARFVAEDWVDVGGEFPMMLAHSVLLDGKKYLSLEDTISTDMEDEFEHSLDVENVKCKERAIMVAEKLGGMVLWSEQPSCEWEGHRKIKEKDFTTAVLVDLSDVAKKHASFQGWRDELSRLDVVA